MKGQHTATWIGLIFTAVSFVATWSFIIPLLTLMPFGLTLELVFTDIFGNDPYSTVGNATLFSLLVLVLLTCFVYYRYLIRSSESGVAFSKSRFILFLLLQMFLVHPLGFDIYGSLDWSRASDGQYILALYTTFPISSFAFLLFGFIADKVRYVVSPSE